MQFDEAAERIAEILKNMLLIDADRALDDARRLIFASVFEGDDVFALADALKCGAAARSIAAEMGGLQLQQVLNTLETARLAEWNTRYAELPENRDGRATRAIPEAGSAWLN